MLKNKSVLEVVKGAREYQFSCEPDSPLGEVFDALCQMKSYVVEKINEAQATESGAKAPDNVEVGD